MQGRVVLELDADAVRAILQQLQRALAARFGGVFLRERVGLEDADEELLDRVRRGRGGDGAPFTGARLRGLPRGGGDAAREREQQQRRAAHREPMPRDEAARAFPPALRTRADRATVEVLLEVLRERVDRAIAL